MIGIADQRRRDHRQRLMIEQRYFFMLRKDLNKVATKRKFLSIGKNNKLDLFPFYSKKKFIERLVIYLVCLSIHEGKIKF